MYKIYNRDLQKDLKFKNLNEVERFIINEYKNNLSNLTLKRFFDVEFHRLTIKEDGKEYKLTNYEAVSIKTGHDYYGNPLYMILIFKDNRHVKTVKSKQSYNIECTVQYILNEYKNKIN